MYQVNDGISLATLLVTEGAWNSELYRCPIIPPKASNGMATSVYKSKITTIVPSGRAAVAPNDMATIFRINTVKNNGPRYRIPVKRTLFSHPVLENWQWKEAVQYPAAGNVSEYITTTEVERDPRLYGYRMPRNAIINKKTNTIRN